MQHIESTQQKLSVHDGPISMSWEALPDRTVVQQTIGALSRRNIRAESLPGPREALARLTEMIPAGAEVMTGGSRTLEQIGFLDLLKSGSHNWKNLKAEILGEKDPLKQMELRGRSTLSEYFVGSVQAVATTGEVIIASASGSQISAYAFGAKNVIWVAGTQKIVPTLEDGLQRVREYALPLEDQRMKGIGYPGSFLGKILIFERDVPQRSISLLFVEKQLGF